MQHCKQPRQTTSFLTRREPSESKPCFWGCSPIFSIFIPSIKSAMQIASPQKSEQTAGRAHPDLFTPVPPGDNSSHTTSLTWFLIHRIPRVVIPKCMSRTPPVHGLIHSLGCKLNPHKSRGQRLGYLKKWMAEDLKKSPTKWQLLGQAGSLWGHKSQAATTFVRRARGRPQLDLHSPGNAVPHMETALLAG